MANQYDDRFSEFYMTVVTDQPRPGAQARGREYPQRQQAPAPARRAPVSRSPAAAQVAQGNSRAAQYPQRPSHQASSPVAVAAPAQARSMQSDDAPARNDEPRENHHVYGRDSALTIEIDTKRNLSATIAIDAAPKTGERSVNWSQKLRFQLTEAELPILAGVFLGMIEEARFDFHGENRNKSLHVVHRNQALLVRLMEGKDRVFTVPLGAGDVYATGMLVIKALTKNMTGMEFGAHMAMVRTACKLWMLDPKNQPKPYQTQQRGAAGG